MKKISSILLAVLSLSMIFFTSSCNDSDNDTLYSSFITISKNFPPDNYAIFTDDSTRLYTTGEQSAYIENLQITREEQRAFIYFTLEDSQEPSNSSNTKTFINIKQISSILTKDIIKTEEIDTLGSDPININNTWFSNGGDNLSTYINIEFSFPTSGISNTQHIIYLGDDLAADAINDELPIDNEGYYNLTFAHNAMEDTQNYTSYNGIVSFPIPSDMLNTKGLKITVNTTDGIETYTYDFEQ